MQCPVCSNTQLVMSERQGIEIDYCPQCRGVWLDRGELDKIIERSSQAPSAEDFGRQPQPAAYPQGGFPQGGFPPSTPPQGNYPQGGYPQNTQHGHYKDDYHYRKKKKGFLGELFDFD